MDPDISQWIAEYLLRQQQSQQSTLSPPLLDSILSLLPLTTTPTSPRLQKTLLLTSLTHDVITEKTLTTLETLEQIAFEEGKPASEKMRRAYFNVALECTARWVGEGGERKEGFLEVVERVWRKRVGKVEEGLGCEEGRMWNDVVEAAVWDDGAVERLVTWRRESGEDVRRVVGEYVNEAWEEMGPAFLEVVAEKGGELVERIRGGGGEGGGERVEVEKGGMDGGAVNTCREMVKVDETKKAMAPVRRKQVAMRGRRRSGAKLSVPEEGNNEVPVSKPDDVPNPDVDGARDPQCSSMNAAVRHPALDAQEKAQPSPSEMEINNMKDDNVVKKRTFAEINVSPEVERVREALKTSSTELRAAVTDPLPDALRKAQAISSAGETQTVRREAAIENQTEPVISKEATEGRDNLASERNIEKRTVAEQHASEESAGKSLDNAENRDTTRESDRGKEVEDPKRPLDHGGRADNPAENVEDNEVDIPRRKYNLRKPSLMEPNETRHTMVWDDSIDNIPDGMADRPRLPSPKKIDLSPLKKQGEIQRLTKRRVRKMWTPLEEDTLRTGVKKFNRGQWKLILHCYSEIFQGRTEVDLKDKWRNMEKHPWP